MNLKNLFMINAVVALVFGAAFALMPEQTLSQYGIKMMPKAGLLMARLFGGCLLALTVGGWFLHPWVALPPLLLAVFVFSFFRDPERKPFGGPEVAVAPADGKVTDIEVVDEPEMIGGPAAPAACAHALQATRSCTAQAASAIHRARAGRRAKAQASTPPAMGTAISQVSITPTPS